MAAARNCLSSLLVTVLLFAMVLSPISTAEATRLPLQVTTRPPICPACVCCEPPPPGSCCRCCAGPIETSSQNGSP